MITAIVKRGRKDMQFNHILTMLGLALSSATCMAGDLFDSDQILEISLTGPLEIVIEHKRDEEAFPFILGLDGGEHPVKVSVRGNSRKRVCKFPPLRLVFDGSASAKSVFYGQDKLKLVTHCNKSDKAQDNVLKEYAAYKFFTMLSAAAYRVRLLRINYVDTDNKRSTKKLAFAIESTGQLARRIDAEPVNVSGVSKKRLNDQQEARVYVFQYLVGNTDWSMVRAEDDDSCCHNGKLLDRNQELLYVPYDFDLTGLVNASYARPNPKLNLTKVTQRLYRGFCVDGKVLAEAIQQVNSHRAEIYATLENLPFSSDRARKKARKYIEKYFEEAVDEAGILKKFDKHCLS